jgi:hypothetical protein
MFVVIGLFKSIELRRSEMCRDDQHFAPLGLWVMGGPNSTNIAPLRGTAEHKYFSIFVNRSVGAACL